MRHQQLQSCSTSTHTVSVTVLESRITVLESRKPHHRVMCHVTESESAIENFAHVRKLGPGVGVGWDIGVPKWLERETHSQSQSERAFFSTFNLHLVDTPRAKKQDKDLPPSQNLLRAGHVPDGCISFQARAMAAAASRAPSQLARRDALSLTVSAPRLSDLLSNSRSGDAADWQVACGSMLWQRRFVSSLELRRARPADGDTSALCGLWAEIIGNATETRGSRVSPARTQCERRS